MNYPIDQSQTVSNANQSFGYSSTVYHAQSFTAGRSNLRGVTFRKGTGSGTYAGNVTISIKEDSSGEPEGSTLATATILNAAWQAISADTDYFITISCALTPTTLYWIVFQSSTADNSNYSGLRWGNPGTYYTGGKVLYSGNGTTWTDPSRDLYFKTHYLSAKSMDGIAKANIKSINSLANANISSVFGGTLN